MRRQLIESMQPKILILHRFHLFHDVLLLFGDINLSCFRLIMEFPPSGGVVPMSRFHIQKLLRYHSSFEYVLLINHIIFFAFCVYYLCEELYEMNYFRWNYAKSFWNWMDLVIVVVSIYVNNSIMMKIFSHYSF